MSIISMRFTQNEKKVRSYLRDSKGVRCTLNFLPGAFLFESWRTFDLAFDPFYCSWSEMELRLD